MRMVGHTTRYGVQRGVGVCSVLRNMCSLCRKGRAGSLVSGSQPLCPPKIGVTSPQGGGGMTTAVPALRSFYRPLRPSGTSPNLGEESGGGLTYRFQVLGTPLLCPSESGGRGAKLRRGYDKRKTERGKRKTPHSSLPSYRCLFADPSVASRTLSEPRR